MNGQVAMKTNLSEPSLRRKQIIEAAINCARKYGFHASSMSEIAKAAGISVGQIYRYFDNKEAIISAIVESGLTDFRETFTSFQEATGDLRAEVTARLPDNIEKCLDPQRAALDLEVLAEAARNPRVGEIVRRAEDIQRDIVVQLLSSIRLPDWSDAEIETRSEILGAIFNGLQTCAVRRPDLDRVTLARMLVPIIQDLFG